jgi:glycosyltransferase involved in cell wall biosynthesis
MSLSVVIPTFSRTEKLTQMAVQLAKQVRPMCDELVITEDAGGDSEELREIADIYLYHAVRTGHGNNLNKGFQASTGDFVAILDSDILLTKGSLRDLCIPEKIVCPGSFKAWCMVSPRQFIEEFPPFENQGSKEGIDVWIKEFENRNQTRIILTDKVEYFHATNASYDWWVREVYRQASEGDPLHPRKEVMHDRHKARLSEDPAYAKEWGHEA